MTILKAALKMSPHTYDNSQSSTENVSRVTKCKDVLASQRVPGKKSHRAEYGTSS